MRTASITETKNGLSGLLEAVKNGESVLITEHNRPIAELTPVSLDHFEGKAWLQALVSDGLVRVSSKPLDFKKFVSLELAKPGKPVESVKALLEERDSGR